MKVSIQNGPDGSMRIINSDDGFLTGVITKNGEQYRVEMLQGIDVNQSNKDRAVGFVHGVAAALAMVAKRR